MLDPEAQRVELMQQVLEPLLDDFIYWFDRASLMLEQERLGFITQVEQELLLSRIRQSLKEVRSADALFKATGKQVGVDVKAMVPWHQLLMECQSIAIRHRRNGAS
jgi:hypothetical protein